MGGQRAGLTSRALLNVPNEVLVNVKRAQVSKARGPLEALHSSQAPDLHDLHLHHAQPTLSAP